MSNTNTVADLDVRIQGPSNRPFSIFVNSLVIMFSLMALNCNLTESSPAAVLALGEVITRTNDDFERALTHAEGGQVQRVSWPKQSNAAMHSGLHGRITHEQLLLNSTAFHCLDYSLN